MKEGLECAKEERRGKNREKRKEKKERMRGTEWSDLYSMPHPQTNALLFPSLLISSLSLAFIHSSLRTLLYYTIQCFFLLQFTCFLLAFNLFFPLLFSYLSFTSLLSSSTVHVHSISSNPFPVVFPFHVPHPQYRTFQLYLVFTCTFFSFH